MATTEKDIKEFMQSHKLQIPRDDKFMSNLVRQIDLLPVPASLEKGGIPEEERKQLLAIILKELKQANLRTVSLALAILAGIWAIICSLLWAGFPYISGWLHTAGIPMIEMGEAIIFTVASAAFILSAVYTFRRTELL